MNRINLQKIMEVHNLSREQVAEALFPMNRYSKSALSRVLRGEGVLDENQIYRLSVMVDVPVSALFEGESWSAHSVFGKMHFFKGDMEAELNLDTFVTKVYDKRTLKTEVVLASKAVTLSEYLNLLNKIVC